MVPEIIAIKTIFLLQAVGFYLTWLYWLQVKDYRVDRFFVFLKSVDGRRELLVVPTLSKFLTLVVGFILNPVLFFYLVEILLLAAYFLILFLKKSLRKPVFTQRVTRISLIALFFAILALFPFEEDFWTRLLFSEAAIVFGPLVGVLITRASVDKTLKMEKGYAKRILQEFKPKVIAITGSYGKTTTKDFITQILASKYKVLSTFKNQNTHFGIIRRIIGDLKADHDFFVVEIGAYKKGEIKEIADILKPNTAVITGLEPQHLELFGSFKNLKEAKFELVESIIENGSAIFNFTNKEVRAFVPLTRKLGNYIKTYSYAVDTKGTFDAQSYIQRVDPKGIAFKVSIGKEFRILTTNIFSKRLIENLTCAILVGRIYGVDWPSIEKTCKKLILPEGTLNVFKTKIGAIVIDDSYNTSPHGFEAALELLAQTKGQKKIILTTGIIELGENSYAIHKNLGKILSSMGAVVLLRNHQFQSALKDGMVGQGELMLMTDSRKMISYLEANIDKNDVILIEGKLPRVVNFLKSS